MPEAGGRTEKGSSSTVVGAARRLDGRLRRRRERVSRDVQRGRELAAAEDLHEVLLRARPCCDQDVGVDLGDAEGGEGVEVDRRVLDAEGVGEALQLGDALDERQLAALEAGGDLATGLLALGATAGRLAALARDAASDDLLAVRRAFG